MAITNGAGNRVYFNYNRFQKHFKQGKLKEGDTFYNKNSPIGANVQDGQINTWNREAGGVPTNGWSG